MLTRLRRHVATHTHTHTHTHTQRRYGEARVIVHTPLDLDLNNNCQTPTDIAENGVDVSYGCSDITEVVSWLLNEDTEAADVTALGREFHSGIVLGVKDF